MSDLAIAMNYYFFVEANLIQLLNHSYTKQVFGDFELEFGCFEKEFGEGEKRLENLIVFRKSLLLICSIGMCFTSFYA
jgi:hypothetical protein